MTQLNLLPYDIREKREKEARIKKYSSIGIIIVLILAVIVVIPNIFLMAMKTYESSLEDKIASNNEIVAKYNKVNNEITNLNNYINGVAEFKNKSKEKMADKIKGLGKYIPADITLSNLSYSSTAINFTAVTKNYNSIPLLLVKLQQEKQFSGIQISGVAKDPKTGYSFTVTINKK